MVVDLSDKSKEELVQIAADVDSALATLEQRKLTDAIDALKQAAQAHGFALETLIETIQAGPARKSRGAGKSKNPAKYRNPADLSQTWTGRGRKPGWIKDAEDAGTDIQEFAI